MKQSKLFCNSIPSDCRVAFFLSLWESSLHPQHSTKKNISILWQMGSFMYVPVVLGSVFKSNSVCYKISTKNCDKTLLGLVAHLGYNVQMVCSQLYRYPWMYWLYHRVVAFFMTHSQLTLHPNNRNDRGNITFTALYSANNLIENWAEAIQHRLF